MSEPLSVRSEQPVGYPNAPEPTADSVAAGQNAARRPILEARGLRRIYIEEDGSELTVLDGVEIRVAPGEIVAVVGASGAGKSTLLHLLGCLDRPTAGEVILDGQPVAHLAERELASIRSRRIGFVFQFHHLLRDFTALENVMMPLLIAGATRGRAAERARDLLGRVGLGNRVSHKPNELSGGEQQRVAVARALANQPAAILADEPSGNLDTHTSEELHSLFFRLRDEHGSALVLATHNRELADRADRVLLVKDSQLHRL